MSRALDVILPAEASNDYRSGRVPLYGYCFMVAVMLFRSSVHFLKPDSGVNSIASIMVFKGDPDPNNIIYLFSADGGMVQMLWVMLYGIVLWRYRNLIPLMFAFMVVESCFGFVVGALHPLDPIYFERTPPGKLAALPKLAFSVIMSFLAVRNATTTKRP